MQDGRDGDSRSADAEPASAGEEEKRPIFPKHAVVGVIDTPDDLSRAVEDLHEAGFDDSSVGRAVR